MHRLLLCVFISVVFVGCDPTPSNPRASSAEAGKDSTNDAASQEPPLGAYAYSGLWPGMGEAVLRKKVMDLEWIGCGLEVEAFNAAVSAGKLGEFIPYENLDYQNLCIVDEELKRGITYVFPEVGSKSRFLIIMEGRIVQHIILRSEKFDQQKFVEWRISRAKDWGEPEVSKFSGFAIYNWPVRLKSEVGAYISFVEDVVPLMDISVTLSYVSDEEIQSRAKKEREDQEEKAAREKKYGEWHPVVDEENEKDTTLILPSTIGSASLVVHCREGTTHVYVDWNQYVGLKSPDVSYKLANGDLHRHTWSISKNNQATFFPTDLEGGGVSGFDSPVQFLLELMKVDSIEIGIDRKFGSNLVSSFNVSRLETAASDIRELCNW